MNSGGMAFPSEGQKYETGLGMRHYSEPGMTLRDWFAGMALQGLLNRGGLSSMEEAAKLSYKQADAMLKAREASNA